ncbi:MAG: 23S rRNA (uracil(1939)-C(5))-methyltransferase RlmD [Oscillospiraceae bacterium]|nr:23S rRNA (uracil(1939)-C(5))-methyltransferase RlmD [Oscillospiraceae bacterium]
MPLSKNQEIKLHIDSVSSEGSGVGRFDGQAVFVSGAAVGDELLVHIIKAKKTYAVGIIKEILVPSKDRISVDCPYFKQCGGCVYRHISYDAEKRIKTQKVKDAFLRLAHIDVPVREIITANTERYRNKAEYPVGRALNGVNIGFYANRSHRIVDAEDCLLQPAEFAEIVENIRKWIFDNHISVWNGETSEGLLRHIYIRKGFLSGEIMVCLVINGENIPKAEELISEVSKISGVKSIVLNINTKNTNVILGENVKVLWGSEKISDTLCGVEIELSPLSFYQVNHDGAQLLYKKAAEYAALSGKETVIDLYCGAGTIGLSMAHKAKKVIGVEIIPEAIEDAKKNAKRNGTQNSEFCCMDAGEAVKMLRDKNIQPDVILLDPPRKGCSKEVLSCVAEMNPERIVYISCDVSTQSRDCAVLKEFGYITKEVTPVDMFPRTAHVESVALITRD